MNLQETVNDIKDNLKKSTASAKDEVTVMTAMINDKEYKAAVFNSKGATGEYVCPAEEMDNFTSTVLANTAGISKAEATSLVENYEYGKKEAASLVAVSKEFVNVYVETGRKLPLGGRENSNCSLQLKVVPEKSGERPVQEDGKTVMKQFHTPGYQTVKGTTGCPVWLRK